MIRVGWGYWKGKKSLRITFKAISSTSDFLALANEIARAYTRQRDRGYWRHKLRSLLASVRANTLTRSRHNVHHHYDLGNDFYKLWLDERMLYTCAYYERAGTTLAQAQVAKLDHVCRKLRLEDLLLACTVCGTGLDTVPLPGDTTADDLLPWLQLEFSTDVVELGDLCLRQRSIGMIIISAGI